MPNTALTGKTALVTGGAKRIGAGIAGALHAAGMNVAIHYQRSEAEARALCEKLNRARAGSSSVHRADLLDTAGLDRLAASAADAHGGLHTLVNNASTFYPTPLGETTEAQWDDLMATNLKAPFFLAQAAALRLGQDDGCIVNLVDVHGMAPLSGHPVYCAAKAGLIMLTAALAQELAPAVRVNGIAPGAILPPSNRPPGAPIAAPGNRLGRWGSIREIADAVLFLVRDATFTTGSVLQVDGGRLLGPDPGT